MENNLYWISTLVFAIILTIILISDYLSSDKNNKIAKSFQLMILWVIFFCLQDSLWGLCESKIINSNTIFFISSEIFHISTVLTTFFWLNYILTYLGEKIRFKKIYLIMNITIVIVELTFVIINNFDPILFSIREMKYVTGPYRPLTFINQHIVYLTSGIATLICAIKGTYQERKKFFSVFIFTLFPILLGGLQLLYPDGPFYSLGYFLGCFVVHMFVFSKDREEISRNKLLKSLADIYYSMHIFDLANDSAERILESPILIKLIGSITSAQQMINTVMNGVVCEEYLESTIKFVDLSTISQRMQNKKHISFEFVGKNFGWTRISFISVEKQSEKQKKILVTTQIIDAEKRSQMELMFQSHHDQLTGVYNRRAYEKEIEKKQKQGIEDNFIYISMDLNGLKSTNDTIGHNAGDEMLKGATSCMNQIFGFCGKIFRIGGDEFCVMLNASGKELDEMKYSFETLVNQWSGELVQKLSVSCGYVCKIDLSNPTIEEIVKLADQKMYQEKSNFYRKNGIDRRGQLDAHAALSTLYSEILKVNLTKNLFEVINIDPKEMIYETSSSKQISKWFDSFIFSELIHPEDKEYFVAKTNLKYLKKYFTEGNKILSLLYRRKKGNTFCHAIMDIIPANDYTNEDQNLFLYVKALD